MSTTRAARGATDDMRQSIHNQIQQWAVRANWVEDEKAERVFWKMGQTTEDFINPNPETCGSYREEASQIYEEIKDEYGLRTVREAHREALDYQDQAKQAAAKKLRENFDAIEAGEREQLVKDIQDEFGEGFVDEVLAAARVDRENPDEGSFPEPREVESHTYEFDGVEATDESPAASSEPVEPEPEPATPASTILAVAGKLSKPARSLLVALWVVLRWDPGQDSISKQSAENHGTVN